MKVATGCWLAGHIAISIEKAQFLQKLEQEVHRQTIELKRSEERYQLLVGLGQIIKAQSVAKIEPLLS